MGVSAILVGLLPAANLGGMQVTDEAVDVSATVLEAPIDSADGLQAEAIVNLLTNELIGSIDSNLSVTSYFTRLPEIVYVAVSAPPPPSETPALSLEQPLVTASAALTEEGSAQNTTLISASLIACGGILVFASVLVVLWVTTRRKRTTAVDRGRFTVRHKGKPIIREPTIDQENATSDSADIENGLHTDYGPRSPGGPVSEESLQADRAKAQLMLAMGALQTLMLARTPQELENAIRGAQMVAGLPPEAIEMARQRLALKQQGLSPEAEAALEERMKALQRELQSKMSMLATLQAKLESMQMAQAQLEHENELLRSSGKTTRVAISEDEEDDQDREDRLAREGNVAAKKALFEALANGLTPTAEQLMERDVHMYRLTDAEIRAEYIFYTSLYLGEGTAQNVRGLAEMTLIKLGEIVDQPQSKRTKLIARQAEEARLAREKRMRDENRSVEERAERQRQAAMNEQAYIECRSRWEQLTVAMMAGGAGLTDEAKALAKRVAHRSELRLVTAQSQDIKRMPPGSFVAMGTSGLQPTEMRAVMHALVTAAPPGAAAQRFMGMLQDKIALLEDFVPSIIDLFDNASADAPLGMASGRGTSSKTTLAKAGLPTAAPSRSGSSLAPPPLAGAAPPPPAPPPLAAAPPPPEPPRSPRKTSSASDPRSAMMDELVRRASARALRVASMDTSPVAVTGAEGSRSASPEDIDIETDSEEGVNAD